MKKLTMIVVALLMIGGVAFAQQSKSDETVEFRPHWNLRLQGGAAYTMGEASFGRLLSPTAQISAAYNFHHAMGVRVGLSGWQGKGCVVVADDIYRFRFAQLNADYVLDLASIIGGFKHDRLVSPYIFAGIGGAYGFDNKEAAQVKVEYPNNLNDIWETLPFFVGRAGLGADFWLAKNFSLGLEMNANYYGDRFNSKTSIGEPLPGDWQFNALLGMKVRFGGNTAPSKAYQAAQEAAAAEAAAKAALEKAEAERLAAEKAAAEKAAAEKAAAEKAAAEKAAAEAAAKAAAEKAAADRATLAALNSKDIFFKIGSYEILKSGHAKLEELASFMASHEDFTLLVVGYADKATGSDAVNAKIAAKRAEVVNGLLLKLGVDESRMEVTSKGASVQPFDEVEKNRVVICTLK